MAKININCGQCAKSKGCEIKKAFRNLATTYKNEYYDIFKLKCPFKTRKYKPGDKVEFTIGIHRYSQEYEWECTWDDDYCDPCNNCRNEEICINGTVTFINERYGKYVKIKGEIYSNYAHNKCIIVVDKSEFYPHKVNEKDNKFLQEVSDKIIDDYESIDRDKQMYIISLEKYINI